MRILLLTTLLVASFYISHAATGDTTIVIAHTNSNLNSPPSNDDEWVVFPNTSTRYRQVIMKFTLGCGTPNCSGWDYTVNASLGKKDGTVDATIVSIDTTTNDTTWSYTDHVDFIEVGRLITPYGTYMANNSNGYNSSWTHPYYYDVTDYVQLLKDSVNVRVHYDGWTDAFSAKIEFLFIEGTPSRTVQDVQQIYNTYIGYPNSAAFENIASSKSMFIASGTTSAKVLVIMTGHGSQGEFDPHSFQINVNGTEVGNRLLWNYNCGVNPIAPQGGTWLFNRANWCPGEKVPVYEFDITPFITPGQYANIDLDFDDFVIGNGESAGYGISAHLITYSAQQDNDVMLEEIIAPNSDKPYLHWNPISTQPKVKIKNTGKLPLTYAEIAYKVVGGQTWYYEWRGNLAPFQSEEVLLPAFSWNGLDTTNCRFTATASWPNNVPDEFEANNTLESSFVHTPVLDSSFIISFRANNHPEENWYVVKNEFGDTISFKSGLNASTTYRDTLVMQSGSYTFDMFDYDAGWGCGDGISFWLNTQNGYETTGQLRFLKLNNQVIKNFSGDFGSNIHYEFTVGYPLGFNPQRLAPQQPVHPTGINEANVVVGMTVYPNPVSDKLNVRIDATQKLNGTLLLTDVLGNSIQTFKLNKSDSYNHSIDVRQLSSGIYYLCLKAGNISVNKRIVVAR
jgi:hypothetical protein